MIIDYTDSQIDPEEVAQLKEKQRQELKRQRIGRPNRYSRNAQDWWQQDMEEHGIPVYVME